MFFFKKKPFGLGKLVLRSRVALVNFFLEEKEEIVHKNQNYKATHITMKNVNAQITTPHNTMLVDNKTTHGTPSPSTVAPLV